MHAMLIVPRTPGNAVPYVEVREMKVLELDLRYRPTQADFTLHLPKHTQYWDGVNPRTAKTLYRDQDAQFAPVSVNDIEPIYNKLQAIAKESERKEAGLAARRDVRTVRTESKMYYVLAVLNGLAIAALAAIYLIRRRRGAPPPA
jgi:lysine/ornithine N-monooxygenase